jgi:hypothetical protein
VADAKPISVLCCSLDFFPKEREERMIWILVPAFSLTS